MTFKLALVLAILQLGLSMPDPEPKKEHVKITNVVDIEMPESVCCDENICMLQMDERNCPVEPCLHLENFYFNINLQKCQPFTYKGSRGLGNRFSTFEECRMKCGGPSLEPTTTATTVTTTPTGCWLLDNLVPDGTVDSDPCGNRICKDGSWVRDKPTISTCCEYRNGWYILGTTLEVPCGNLICENQTWVALENSTKPECCIVLDKLVPDGTVYSDDCGNQICTDGSWVRDNSTISTCCEYNGHWFPNGSILEEYCGNRTCDEGTWNTCRINCTWVGNQCLVFHMDEKNWINANTSCSDNGGRLASFEDNHQAVLDYTNKTYKNKEFWAGGSDIAKEGSWLWLNGQPFDDKVYWYPGEPTNYADEDCLLVNYAVGEHFWNGYYDDVCSKEHGYICELERCPTEQGFFIFELNQCFKLFSSTKTWGDAKTFCETQNLRLAEPLDSTAVELRKYLLNNYGSVRAWLGAQYKSDYMRWESNGQRVNPANDLWLTNTGPHTSPDPGEGLVLLVLTENMADQPGHPYLPLDFSYRYRPLCQMVLE